MPSLLAGLCADESLLAFAQPPDDQDTQQILDRIRQDLHPGQRAFVDDDNTQIVCLSAGYGAGKTRGLCA